MVTLSSIWYVWGLKRRPPVQWRCQGWWHPGRDFMVSPFFSPKTNEDLKKVFAVKLVGFQPNEVGDQTK